MLKICFYKSSFLVAGNFMPIFHKQTSPSCGMHYVFFFCPR